MYDPYIQGSSTSELGFLRRGTLDLETIMWEERCIPVST